MRCIILGLFLLAPLAALDVGQPAPPLTGVTWIKGEAAEPGGGRVAVVEFWATWCPPCRDSIPHLTKLQKQHGDKVAIIGLSDEDRATVEPFVADMAAKMDYRVGLADEATKAAYMTGVRGIPHAFLVGADGTVLWKGHPAGIDQPLAKVLAGTFDAASEGEAARLQGELEALFSGKNAKGQPDFERALAISGELLALQPENEMALQVRLGVAKHLERPELHAETLAALPVDQMSAARLNGIAWNLLNEDDFAWRAPEHAVRFAKAAHAKEPENGAIADTWARALYSVGLVDEAIAAQRHAIAAAGGEEAAGLEASLAYYERIKALQATVADAPAAGADAPERVEAAVP
ncbi:MAG TPA: redoxin family protein [Planctomycetota bacterium]|nr:redoxin family protein [Planctomycetota bacterium]